MRRHEHAPDPAPLLSCALAGSLIFLASGCAPRAEAAPRAITPRGDLTAEEHSNIEVFETWKGSVVIITTSSRVMDFWTRDVMSVPRGTGSGFVWDEQGHIVTNLHVVAEAAEATVKLADGRDYPASLVGVSEAHDIAVLKIAPRASRWHRWPSAPATICASVRRCSPSATRSVSTGRSPRASCPRSTARSRPKTAASIAT
jgi:S1-C subfamily serine protease